MRWAIWVVDTNTLVFLSHAEDDAQWARRLVDVLEREGVPALLRERDIGPGQVKLHEVEEAIGKAPAAILVLSASALADRALYDEYAALLQQSTERGLRLIPTLHGSAAVRIPPLAGTRLWADFRDLGPVEYDNKAVALAAVLRGDVATFFAPAGAGARTVPVEVLDVARPERSGPDGPPPPEFVVTYARADADFGVRLVDRLTGSGLPAWSIADLAWGSRWVYEIRQRLRHALAIVVVMSPAAEQSEDVEREILEGQWYGREFFPVLLRGDRNFLLACSSYFDARGEILPGEANLRRLRRIHQAHLAGQPVTPPEPVVRRAAAPVARVPEGIPLRRLRVFLKERELAHADLLTTSLLLAAARRLDRGWMEPEDADALQTSLLAEIDEIWSEQTGGQQGFRRQLEICRLGADRGDFLDLAAAYGWKPAERTGRPRYGERDAMPKYREFVDRAPYPPGFFPTLRNQQLEAYPSWYVRWRCTAEAMHRRLGRWSEKEGHR